MTTCREPGPRLGGMALIVVLALAMAATGPGAAAQEAKPAPARPGATTQAPPTSLFDPRFEEVRRASVVWDNRIGPERQVVDMVCLVPDLATFLEVVATWDERHYFPVLLDDVEYSLKFLRAFRPARVVRHDAKAVEPPAPDAAWRRAVEAVGRSWTQADEKAPRGDLPPTALGPTPPGVVVSAPDSPMLAAAAALAAGRFQPLLRWETPKHYLDVPTRDEARAMALSLEATVADLLPHYDQLGDDCDFVTLAGDYPYRYAGDSTEAFDDLLLRAANSPRRWGFAGRLSGDATRSLYQAMCSLFLRPDSALLFNGYGKRGRPWSDYAMDRAADRLAPPLKVTHRNADRAGLAGWHRAFDPINPYGLVLVNSHGGPTIFHLNDEPAQTSDVPETVPAAVLIIHSFSAESPHDPQTIAGRWLANGAFAYFGSVNEPFLQAFRTPGLLASFLAENLPIVAAARQLPPEQMSKPWRLTYLGDPLYRIKPVGRAAPRLARWEPVDSWKSYTEFQQPGDDQPEALRLKWALRTAIFLTQTSAEPQQKIDLAGTLLAIARDRLDPGLRALHDDLLIDTMLQAGRSSELIDRLVQIPPAERSPDVVRHLETAEMAALAHAQGAKNARQAMALWSIVIRTAGSRDFVRSFTERVGRLCRGDEDALAAWRGRLRSALQDHPDPANLPIIDAELVRSIPKGDAAAGGH